MCEIFPEVPNCLGFPLRIGMVVIALLSIGTGALTMALLEKNYAVGLWIMVKQSLKLFGYFAIAIVVPKKFIKTLMEYIPHGIGLICLGFMLCGYVLLFATLSNQEGFIQVFIWVTFFDVMVGFLLLFGIGYECLMYPVCFLSAMDWLTSTVVFMLVGTYLSIWIYFIAVANSFVLLQ